MLLAARPRRSVPPAADWPVKLRGRRRSSWRHCLLPGVGPCGALPVALFRPAWEWLGCASARCGSSWTGTRDRRQMMLMSVRPAGRWGLHVLCLHPRGRQFAVLRGGACGCGAGIGQGSLLPGAGLVSRPSSPGHERCLGPTAVRMVGGAFCLCRREKPHRVVAPGGVSGSQGALFAWGALGSLGTVVASLTRRVPWSLGTQGWLRCCALHGCTDAEGRALVPQPV